MPVTVLTPLERRVVGNLSIPRNSGDLLNELRRDKVAKNAPVVLGGDPRELTGLLEDLVDAGLLVKIAGGDPAAAVRAVERSKQAVTMHDDKARNYVTRLTRPGDDLLWRADGDLYAYTTEAHDYLTGPDPGVEAVELDAADVRARIFEEASRVAHELELDSEGRLRYDPDAAGDSPNLSDRLLLDEFQAWEATVLEDLEKRTGIKVPPHKWAAGGSYGDATELLILAADHGGTAYGETSPTYGVLTTVAPTDADTGSTLTRANYTGYADKSIASTDFNAPSAGAKTNANAITWAGATAGTSTCIGFARVTTLGGGRLIRRATIASVVVSATNTPASIASGALSESLD